MPKRTIPFDPAKYLKSEEGINAYFEEALEIGDPAFIADALGIIARARGMTKIAEETGLSRESLYKTLSSEGNPQLGTLMRVAEALGLKVSITVAN